MSGNLYFDQGHGLFWRKDLGMGFLELTETPYDAKYFEKYVGYANTDFGENLNNARVELVNRYSKNGCLVDIGIGSGQFVEAIGGYGFDVNPVAIEFLENRQLLLDPYSCKVDYATFWDSLEHIKDIAAILKNVRKYCFVSIPIFNNMEHVLESKHFRPDEHCWYFTHYGFIKFMDAHGFIVIEHNTMETDLGREDIGTYICKRAS